MKLTVYPTLSLLAGSQVLAQTAIDNAETSLAALQQWYNTTSGIWDSCGWWNGANCMTVLAGLAAVDSNALSTATSVFANTYTQAPNVNPAPQYPNSAEAAGAGTSSRQLVKTVQNGDVQSHYSQTWPQQVWHNVDTADAVNSNAWLDGYYDDAGWWALAWIAAYDLTETQDYLNLAEGIFDGMTDAWPTSCSNGGIWWDDTHTYVNAIANELFLSVAAHLANRVPSNQSYYVNWAQEEWAWFQASGMINSENLINDGLLEDCGNNGATVWSYNQGVVLGGLVELNKAAPDTSLLAAANAIATAAIANLTDVNNILHDTCEPDCAPDGTQFKGIFMRNLQELNAVEPQQLYQTFIQDNANAIWSNDRNSENQLSITWSGPFESPVNASTHSSAMGALVAAVAALA